MFFLCRRISAYIQARQNKKMGTAFPTKVQPFPTNNTRGCHGELYNIRTYPFKCCEKSIKQPRKELLFMQKSILEALARGEIFPFTGSMKRDRDYEQANQLSCDSEQKLKSALSTDLKETFEQYISAQDEISSADGFDQFIYGYRLGVLMMVEVFNGREVATSGRIN